MERQEILNTVKKQVELLRDTFPKDEQFVIDDNMILFGADSSIDSLSLVSLIVDIESLFFDEYNIVLNIMAIFMRGLKVRPTYEDLIHVANQMA